MTCPNCGAADVSGRACHRCGAVLPAADAGPALPPSTPAVPAERPWAKYAVGCGAVLLAACVGFLLVASVPDPVALGLSAVAAMVPALFYGWLVLRLDRYEAEPVRAILAAFGWGAIGAIFFSVIGGVFFEAILVAAVDPESGHVLSAALGAPIIEETFKGVALIAILVLYRQELDNVLDGLVYGALIGLGFAMTENILYFGAEYLQHGLGGLGELFVARSILDGFGHAAYTATTGAAIGWARQQYRHGVMRFLVPLLGWSLAVIQHFLWNAGIFVIAGALGDDVGTLEVVLIEAPLFVLPAVAVLFVIARLAGRRELRVICEQLASEVDRGTLTPAEYDLLSHDHLRREALQEASRRGGRDLRDRQRRFFQVAAELAFRKFHLSRGEEPKPGQRGPEDAYREELATLRTQLSAAGLPAVGATTA